MDDLSIHELVGISRSYPDFLIPPKKRFAGGTLQKDATDIPVILVRFSALWSGIVCHIRNGLAASVLTLGLQDHEHCERSFNRFACKYSAEILRVRLTIAIPAIRTRMI
jgi:hypothetical protein